MKELALLLDQALPLLVLGNDLEDLLQGLLLPWIAQSLVMHTHARTSIAVAATFTAVACLMLCAGLFCPSGAAHFKAALSLMLHLLAMALSALCSAKSLSQMPINW